MDCTGEKQTKESKKRRRKDRYKERKSEGLQREKIRKLSYLG